MDSKSEWCKALGYKIENIRGDGNCLYTSLWKTMQMTGNQVRESIVEKSNLYWSVILDVDTDGEEFINFLCETSDKRNGEEPDKWPYLPKWKMPTLTSIVMGILSRLSVMTVGMSK
eukprot:12114457-Heterocapsa_arctica.AAC.1